MTRSEVPPYSYAHGVALDRLKWYRGAARRAMIANAATYFVLLAVGAGTIVAAAVSARPAVTATLAALSFLLTGARSYFDWNTLAITRAIAREEIQARIDHYMSVPEPDRSTSSMGTDLVDDVHEIARTERATWSTLRRQRSQAPEHDLRRDAD